MLQLTRVTIPHTKSPKRDIERPHQDRVVTTVLGIIRPGAIEFPHRYKFDPCSENNYT